MAGRSNLQQAVPITFGYKMATILAGFERHKQRLAELRKRVEVGEFGGAAGTLSSLGKDGLKCQVELMKELKLGQPAISWHTVRDCIAEVGCFLGPRYRLLRQDRLRREAADADRSRGGLRAVPCRPRLVLDHAAEAQSDFLASTSRRRTAMVKQLVAALLEAMIEDHERATGPWQIEWIALPEIFMLSAGALAQTRSVLEGLQVNEKKMRANLDITNGLIMSEAVMMGLGAMMGRDTAHHRRRRHRPRSLEERPAVDRRTGGEQGHRQIRRPQETGRIDGPGELSRRRRRDGGSGAGDEEVTVMRAKAGIR